MQNSLKDTARKKKLDLTSVCHNMTPGHNFDRWKEVLSECNFEGRARGEYFSSRDYGITGDQECVQMRRKIGIAVITLLATSLN